MRVASLDRQVKEFVRMLGLSLIHGFDTGQKKVKRERGREVGMELTLFDLLCWSNSDTLGPGRGSAHGIPLTWMLFEW